MTGERVFFSHLTRKVLTNLNPPRHRHELEPAGPQTSLNGWLAYAGRLS